jgi:hypothetical protein
VEFRSPLYLLFIDFEKAFDSVRREYIWAALRNKGIPQKIVAIIKASYDGATCRVLHRGKLSEQFQVHSGLRQGCSLSPFLFLLVISDVLCKSLANSDKGIRWTLFNRLNHLDYADDITFLSHQIMDLSEMVPNMERETLIAGLKINGPKTKLMSVTHEGTTGPQPQICIGNHNIEVVNSFTYLGSDLSIDVGTELDVE